MRTLFFIIAVSIVLAACAPQPTAAPVGPTETIAQQLARKASFLADARYSSLLDFESPDDALFATGGTIDGTRAFTGQKSLHISAGVATVKLSTLLAGRPFPENWSMIGGFVFCTKPSRVTLRLGTLTDQVNLPAGQWTPAFLNVPPNAAVAPLEILLPAGETSAWLDDVMLVDNQKSLLPATTDGWKIVRRGTQITGTQPDLFTFALTSADVTPMGWTCDEANVARARFHTVDGKTLTIYSDGRAFNNGEYQAMNVRVSAALYAQHHQHPATIEIADDMGRVDRNTRGDSNNDGYNETTGSYRIIAQAARVELRFVPAAAAPRPVLEISGLPFGKVLATLEGRLIETSQRTADGNLLIELPATIDRPATVDVRVGGIAD